MTDIAQEPGENARSVFAGLVPTSLPEEAGQPQPRSRMSRGVMHTVPILLVGSMAAMTLNLTGPVESASAKRPPQPRDAATDLRKTAKPTMIVAAAATAAPRTATAVAPASYRVAAGDTVSEIAGRFGLSTASVLALNGLGWSSLIFPGQELKLTASGAAAVSREDEPADASGRYTIVSGDTISAIAHRSGVSTLSLLAANGLGWDSIIYPGQTISIPGLVGPGTPAPEPSDVSDSAATVDETSDKPDGDTDPIVTDPIEGDTVTAEPIVTVPVVEVAPVVEAPVVAAPPPAPVTGSYTIVSGDTVSKIAAHFGISTQALLAANGLSGSSVIYAGHTLVIPGVSTPAPAPTPANTGGSITYLNDEMRANAAIIVQVGREQGVPDYGIVIALATAMQESSLRNLDWGDRDSLGLFQQRPSSGWGSFEELTNPYHAAYLFYQGRAGYTRGLFDISGWSSMPLTQAAQRVQISAYPDAYAKWEASAWAWFAELG